MILARGYDPSLTENLYFSGLQEAGPVKKQAIKQLQLLDKVLCTNPA